ncbi:endonuclease Q family protein, partial [Caldithrix abyssi]
MRFIADLHIHSHFSVATSKDLIPEKLDYWARIKGIPVVGTGDFTHPGWLKELKEKLEPAEDGLFKLKEELRLPGAPDTPVRFLLSAEISSIYKKNNKVRKIHNVILAPDFESVEQMQARLSRIGNITSDGRPILGLDAKDLLELTLEVNEDNFFIPAHIWTPWFSALGSKSGFDSIEECFEDLTQYIYAVETGLSSDPPMNWLCSFLDRFTLISNSDAHSPEKLGREANIFQAELSYRGIIEALKNPDSQKFAGTVEFYPQEGKYHLDGHRKCGVRWDPLQTLQNKGICPVCGKKVTVGVLNRVAQLSDREEIEELPGRKPFYSLIPLKEALSEILQTGPNTKTVDQAYQALIQKAGSEFNLLLNLPL